MTIFFLSLLGPLVIHAITIYVTDQLWKGKKIGRSRLRLKNNKIEPSNILRWNSYDRNIATEYANVMLKLSLVSDDEHLTNPLKYSRSYLGFVNGYKIQRRRTI